MVKVWRCEECEREMCRHCPDDRIWWQGGEFHCESCSTRNHTAEETVVKVDGRCGYCGSS